MCQAVRAWWLRSSVERHACCNVLVGLFSYDYLGSDVDCILFNFAWFDDFEGFIFDEYFVHFFVDGGVDFCWVEVE